jgi:hypothetical protein
MLEFRNGYRIAFGVLALALVWGWAPAAEVKASNTPTVPQTELTGLKRLLAMEEMKNLRLTFCRSLDNHNWAALKSTMADDFELYFADISGSDHPSPPTPVQLLGADKFVEFVKQILGKGRSIHICTMPQFEFVGTDRSRALWFINGYGNIGDSVGLGFERLVEDYVRVNGKWLIKKSDGRIEAHVTLPQ